MSTIDLRPAAAQMTRLVGGVDDHALDRSTPCPDYTVTGLLGHVGGFAKAFIAAANKDLGPMTSAAPDISNDPLPAGWREEMTRDLVALGESWQSPDAWNGMTQAGGIDLPGPVAGRVALDELVVHAWDLARATSQTYECDDATLREVEATVRQFRNGNDGPIPGLFGPVVAVPADAPTLDRLLGLTGRDPAWSPS